MCNFRPDNSPPPPYSECEATATPATVGDSTLKEQFPKTHAQVVSILSEYFRSKGKPDSLDGFKILTIQPKNAYSYFLNTLTEKRTLIEITTPNKNQDIDGEGRIPRKWEIPVSPPISLANYGLANYDCFQAGETLPLPHSERVVDCPECGGKGRKTCAYCKESCFTRCTPCFGTGWRETLWGGGKSYKCQNCTATGKTICANCASFGSLKCTKCEGYGSLVISRAVEMVWECRYYEDFTERGPLTETQLSESRGWERCQECSLGPVHKPLNFESNEEITRKGGQRLMSVLRKQDSNLKVVQIKHGIGEIPVIKVTYGWEKQEKVVENGEFYIFSRDCTVYFPSHLGEVPDWEDVSRYLCILKECLDCTGGQIRPRNLNETWI